MSKARGTILGLAGVLACAAPAWALQAERSVTVPAPADEVWAQAGPFCAIQEWHPAVQSCTEEVRGDAQLRRLGLAGGGEILEELISRDEDARQYVYRILESPLPVADYRSSLTVDSVEGGSRVVWKSTFEAKGVSQEEAEEVIGGIYDAGLAGIQEAHAE